MDFKLHTITNIVHVYFDQNLQMITEFQFDYCDEIVEKCSYYLVVVSSELICYILPMNNSFLNFEISKQQGT